MSACATGGHAVGEAYETIRRDDADVMLAGGSEAGIYEALVGGFAAMRALIDEINGFAAPRSEYLFSPELVVRGSTAITAGQRGAVSAAYS